MARRRARDPHFLDALAGQGRLAEGGLIDEVTLFAESWALPLVERAPPREMKREPEASGACGLSSTQEFLLEEFGYGTS
jgi:hypothetical protein